ncbi:hypothetical protein OF117_15015 [Geodermatophilus sp. YIM 151500]|uniref:hypothetical protein n=1 Tax=Geodermatophilus sp. YIM 151500 TaxID=2984531 RepID=UPI0021E4C259|nr:hypothetical protein [Geodermatophilus sp. YIM 151500]MCV2490671.1 hypothetical protein [Geodermatophilus sp. YIM 151500]
MGLAAAREGILARGWCWPGNTNDSAVLRQVKDDLRAWWLGRVFTVVDRCFSSAANLALLRRAGGHFIAGERMHAGTTHVEEVLARQGRYRTVRDNLRVMGVRLEFAPDLRWVLCVNPDEAARAATQREAALERIQPALARITTARTRLATPSRPPRRPPPRAHIRAHVLLCWLALLLIRVAERRTGQTWPALARERGWLHAVTLTGPTGRPRPAAPVRGRGAPRRGTGCQHRGAPAIQVLQEHPQAPRH